MGYWLMITTYLYNLCSDNANVFGSHPSDSLFLANICLHSSEEQATLYTRHEILHEHDRLQNRPSSATSLRLGDDVLLNAMFASKMRYFSLLLTVPSNGRIDKVLDTCILGSVEKGFALRFFGVVGLA